LICTNCHRPITATYQPDKGDWQRVWAETKDGPAHVPECPAPSYPINQDDEE
jgi:hypothetical protein